MPIGWGSFWKRTHQHQLDLVLQENILTLVSFPELFILLNTHWMNYESGSLMIYAKQIWKPYKTYWDLGKAGRLCEEPIHHPTTQPMYILLLYQEQSFLDIGLYAKCGCILNILYVWQ